MRARSLFAGVVGFVCLGLVLAVPATAAARDKVPPAAVTDLRVVAVEPSAVTLEFTATGDDGVVGQATTYDLRYATFEITASTWDVARKAYSEPAPQPAGALETVKVSTLFPSITYFFALRVADEAGNLSGLSNVPVATTDPAPPSPWSLEVLPAVGRTLSLDFFGGEGEFSIGCAYAENDTTVVALLFDGVLWHREVVDTNVEWGGGADFTFAPDGTPTIGYGCDGKGLFKKGMRFARRTPDGTWNVDIVELGGATKGTMCEVAKSLEFDPHTAEPTLVYSMSDDSKMRFAQKVGGLDGTWQVEAVAVTTRPNYDLVYDSEGRPVIAYIGGDIEALDPGTRLDIATRGVAGWEIETLHAHDGFSWTTSASVMLGQDGNLVAADSAYWAITVFRKAPGDLAWSDGEVAVPDAWGLRAAVDGHGVPFVVFTQWDDGMMTRPYVAFDDGGVDGWPTERVSYDDGGMESDIARDPDGGLGVLYSRADGTLVLARRPVSTP